MKRMELCPHSQCLWPESAHQACLSVATGVRESPPDMQTRLQCDSVHHRSLNPQPVQQPRQDWGSASAILDTECWGQAHLLLNWAVSTFFTKKEKNDEVWGIFRTHR